MAWFEKKQVTIEAERFPDCHAEPKAYQAFRDWLRSYDCTCFFSETGLLEIITPEGLLTASPGDYVIRGIQGEFYPCKADVFHATYRAVQAS